MARRRMFTTELVSADSFLSLRPSSQLLYFHLNIHADDEGFVSAAKSLCMLCGSTVDDLKELEDAGFVISFSTGVLVIVHWFINNTIRKDRSTPTIHRNERSLVTLVDNLYTLTDQQPSMSAKTTTKMSTNLSTKNFTNMATQNRIDKSRIEENRSEEKRIDNNRSEYIRSEESHGAQSPVADEKDRVYDPNTIPDFKTIYNYCQEHGLTDVNIAEFISYYAVRNWTDNQGNPIRNWMHLLHTWESNEISAYNQYLIDHI